MAEALYQTSTSSLSGEEPFINDGLEGELFTNTANARIWVVDPAGVPLELGGAVKNKPIDSLVVANYLSIDVSNTINLPIANTDPMSVPSGFYREYRILLNFNGTPLSLAYSQYFDYPVNWGLKSLWDNTNTTNSYTNPIDLYKAENRSILVELSSFGPQSQWTGRVLWVNALS